MKKGIVLYLILSIVALIAPAGVMGAAAYPIRPINLVICYSPGSTDMTMRPFTEKITEYIGQQMVYVYKPGAAGSIGAGFVARSKSDGYTLVGTSNSPVLIAPLTKELDYSLEDFVPIVRLVKSPNVLVVRGDAPWKNLKEYIEDAKKNPGKITYATSGYLSSNHLPMEMFAKMAGIQLTHIPTDGTAAGVKALLGGHVGGSCATMASAAPHLKTKDLRALTLFEKERVKSLPDVPTATELGFPVVYTVWYGWMAPKGISKEVVNSVYAGARKVLENYRPFLEDRLKNLFVELDFAGPEEFAKDVKAENEDVKKILKDLGVKKEK
jgi:tripartite-type tricarboxylate transporter receptor subunit TctC